MTAIVSQFDTAHTAPILDTQLDDLGLRLATASGALMTAVDQKTKIITSSKHHNVSRCHKFQSGCCLPTDIYRHFLRFLRSEDGLVKLWDVSAEDPLFLCDLDGHSGPVHQAGIQHPVRLFGGFADLLGILIILSPKLW